MTVAVRVQEKTASGNGTTVTVVLDNPPQEGNKLIAVISSAGGTPHSVSSPWLNLPGSNARGSVSFKEVTAGDVASQTIGTLNSGVDWTAHIVEYSGIDAQMFAAAGVVAGDTSSPMDVSGLDPLQDNKIAAFLVITTANANRTFSGHTIGGVAATEVTDSAFNSTSASIAERLNVNVGTGTWAAQVTASGAPSNGNIFLVALKVKEDNFLDKDLMSLWRMEEASGTRNTTIGALSISSLTDNNTVTSAAGKLHTNAAQFNSANNEWLSKSQNYWNIGDESWTILGWVWLDSKSADMVFASRNNNSTTREWLIEYDSANDRFRMTMYAPAGTSLGNANGDIGEPQTGQWFFIAAGYDKPNARSWLQINNGTVKTQSLSGAPGVTAASFKIGASGTTSQFWNGRIDHVLLYRRKLSQTELDIHWNGGAGLADPVNHQIVYATAIDSVAAVGSPAVQPGAVTVSPTGITNTEAVGSPAVQPGNVNVSATGIDSTSSVGQPAVTQDSGDVTVELTGIASTAAVGEPAVQPGDVTVSLTAIDSGASVGQPAVTPGDVTVSLTGVDSTVVVGEPEVQPGEVSVQPTGIASTGAVGSPSVSVGAVTVDVSGIASTSGVGSPTLTTEVDVNVSGYSNTSTVGEPSVSPGGVNVNLSGIDSTANVGAPEVQQEGVENVFLTGIASTSNVGSPTVIADQIIGLVGVASTIAVGQPSLLPGGVTVSPVGIGESNVVGQPRIDLTLNPTGYANASTVGQPSVEPGVVTVSPTGITNLGSVGQPSLLPGPVTVDLSGIAPGGSVGLVNVLLAGAQVIDLTGIDSILTIGLPGVFQITHLDHPLYVILDSDGQTFVILDSTGETLVVLDSDVPGTIEEISHVSQNA